MIFGISDNDQILGLADAEDNAEKDSDMRLGAEADRTLSSYGGTSVDSA